MQTDEKGSKDEKAAGTGGVDTSAEKPLPARVEALEDKIEELEYWIDELKRLNPVSTLSFVSQKEGNRISSVKK